MFTVAGGENQPMVVLSTSEAEHIALRSAPQEAVWIKRLLEEIPFREIPFKKPVLIHEANQGTVALPSNPIAHARTKHIDT